MSSHLPAFGKPRRGDARVALLDAALSLVRRQGWSATSVDQLCHAAGVTKGAFFHHFASKEALGVAAAVHWSAVTGALFAAAPYHAPADPLDRIFAYLDFRSELADGPLEEISCFAGTAVQEMFATSDPIRMACAASIAGHAQTLEADFAAALVQHGITCTDARSLALHTQAVLQGGFILAKALDDDDAARDAVAHLRRYLELLFAKGT